MSGRVVTRKGILWAGLALAATFGPVAAQEQVDSTQIRIMERLQRLGRPPGFDSILFTQDSLAQAAALEGRRGTSSAGGDSVTAVLLSMPGFTLTEYDAGSATFEAEDRVLLLIAPAEEDATVAREGLMIAADTSILFDESSGLLQAVGNSTFTPPEGDPVESVTMIYDMNQA
ncbi:MAG: hypothetical protein VX815_18430, partial [Gemmatimonadota bacterium]|nr:hypothetical protein [Gemmatimonadota bacterium]